MSILYNIYFPLNFNPIEDWWSWVNGKKIVRLISYRSLISTPFFNQSIFSSDGFLIYKKVSIGSPYLWTLAFSTCNEVPFVFNRKHFRKRDYPFVLKAHDDFRKKDSIEDFRYWGSKLRGKKFLVDLIEHSCIGFELIVLLSRIVL